MENILPIQLHTNFKSDTNLVSRILELTNKSYVTNTQLIEREIEHNGDIYIITNDREELLAFFMVNFEQVIGIDSYYLGLSACRDDLKGKGLGKSLYLNFLKNCREKEIQAQKKFLLWWTTATPIVYYWFNKYVSNVQPDMNGNFDEYGRNIVESIIKEKFPELEIDKQHPFILRAIAGNTVYSANEQQRLIQATENLGMDVFQRFNLKEENADRFLMFGYAPD